LFGVALNGEIVSQVINIWVKLVTEDLSSFGSNN